jgi:hypothetical protein
MIDQFAGAITPRRSDTAQTGRPLSRLTPLCPAGSCALKNAPVPDVGPKRSFGLGRWL